MCVRGSKGEKDNNLHIPMRENVAKTTKETFKGIHFTEDEERNFKKYMKLTQTMKINTESIKFHARVAEAMDITISEVNYLRNMVNCKLISEIKEDKLLKRLRL